MIHLFLYKTLWDLNNSISSVGSTSSLHSDMNKNDMQWIHWIWTWHISRNTSHTQDLNLTYPKEPQSQETWGKALDYKTHEKWKQWRNQATTMNWRRVHMLLFLFQWSFLFLKTTISKKTRNETPILKADKQEPRSMNLDNTTFPRTKSKITQGQYCPRYPVSSSFYLLSLVLLLLLCRKIIFHLISHHESSPRKGIKEPAPKSNNKHI